VGERVHGTPIMDGSGLPAGHSKNAAILILSGGLSKHIQGKNPENFYYPAPANSRTYDSVINMKISHGLCPLLNRLARKSP